MAKNDPIMAGVTLAAGAFGDPRFEYLAELCGFADADHARGKMAKLVSRCTALGTKTPDAKTVVVCLGKRNAPEAIVEADLGELMTDGTIRLKGSDGRTDWLLEAAERGAVGGSARANSARRGVGGKFVRSTTNHQQTTSDGASLEPASQRPPDQDQDQDLDQHTHTGSESSIREPSVIGGGDQALVTRGALPPNWRPSDTHENLEADMRATERGVVVPFALEKFLERSRALRTLAFDWDAAWRAFLITEHPTTAPIRDALVATERRKAAKAALDREREQDRNAAAQRPSPTELWGAVREASHVTGFHPAPEKATG